MKFFTSILYTFFKLSSRNTSLGVPWLTISPSLSNIIFSPNKLDKFKSCNTAITILLFSFAQSLNILESQFDTLSQDDLLVHLIK